MSGEEGEAERFPFPILDLFSGPQSDKPRGVWGLAPNRHRSLCRAPQQSENPALGPSSLGSGDLGTEPTIEEIEEQGTVGFALFGHGRRQ
jgi:hypothetical protein